MPCLLVVLSAMMPRIVLIGMFFTGYLQRAVEGVFWPLVGWFCMPFTTCAYVIGVNENAGFRGWSLVLLIVAVVLDVSHHGGAVGTGPLRRRTRPEV